MPLPKLGEDTDAIVRVTLSTMPAIFTSCMEQFKGLFQKGALATDLWVRFVEVGRNVKKLKPGSALARCGQLYHFLRRVCVLPAGLYQQL